jgi:hypothetical protein
VTKEQILGGIDLFEKSPAIPFIEARLIDKLMAMPHYMYGALRHGRAGDATPDYETR